MCVCVFGSWAIFFTIAHLFGEFHKKTIMSCTSCRKSLMMAVLLSCPAPPDWRNACGSVWRQLNLNVDESWLVNWLSCCWRQKCHQKRKLHLIVHSCKMERINQLKNNYVPELHPIHSLWLSSTFISGVGWLSCASNGQYLRPLTAWNKFYKYHNMFNNLITSAVILQLLGEIFDVFNLQHYTSPSLPWERQHSDNIKYLSLYWYIILSTMVDHSPCQCNMQPLSLPPWSKIWIIAQGKEMTVIFVTNVSHKNVLLWDQTVLSMLVLIFCYLQDPQVHVQNAENVWMWA